MVAEAAEKAGFPRPVITLEESDTALWAGMDSTIFMEKTGWKPKRQLLDSIIEIMASQ